jgi:hypothetical protein
MVVSISMNHDGVTEQPPPKFEGHSAPDASLFQHISKVIARRCVWLVGRSKRSTVRALSRVGREGVNIFEQPRESGNLDQRLVELCWAGPVARGQCTVCPPRVVVHPHSRRIVASALG